MNTSIYNKMIRSHEITYNKLDFMRSLLILVFLLALHMQQVNTYGPFCLVNSINLTNEATHLDYAQDNSLFAVTSVPANTVWVY